MLTYGGFIVFITNLGSCFIVFITNLAILEGLLEMTRLAWKGIQWLENSSKEFALGDQYCLFSRKPSSARSSQDDQIGMEGNPVS
ncbi:Hypothetical predicted protein [Olea europaea subsp. europaea]|uniref:Uncharacterized protein n=1 Tax=Olea europaea subsp. europaea TaxID=158383 RepID=A0A8S0SWJ8_OLEEU|nr:Hypothetical predicted protein [Olea europaea subsp. europaea]